MGQRLEPTGAHSPIGTAHRDRKEGSMPSNVSVPNRSLGGPMIIGTPGTWRCSTGRTRIAPTSNAPETQCGLHDY